MLKLVVAIAFMAAAAVANGTSGFFAPSTGCGSPALDYVDPQHVPGSSDECAEAERAKAYKVCPMLLLVIVVLL